MKNIQEEEEQQQQEEGIKRLYELKVQASL